MGTEYCDAWTYEQVYGHKPPTDGSYDSALGDPGEALNVTIPPDAAETETTGDTEPTTKVVAAPKKTPAKKTETAETK